MGVVHLKSSPHTLQGAKKPHHIQQGGRFGNKHPADRVTKIDQVLLYIQGTTSLFIEAGNVSAGWMSMGSYEAFRMRVTGLYMQSSCTVWPL